MEGDEGRTGVNDVCLELCGYVTGVRGKGECSERCLFFFFLMGFGVACHRVVVHCGVFRDGVVQARKGDSRRRTYGVE